ncbi:MAG: helix-turn-helix domain-containing protein [Oscillochloridaceae bacterium umkhey_bin13]
MIETLNALRKAHFCSKLVAALTQAEMATRLGTVREMVGRTLKGFEAQGLIRIDRGVIEVVDRVGLEEQAER